MSPSSEVTVRRAATNIARPAFTAFGTLQREIDRLFDEFGHASWSPFANGGAAVSMDLAETKDAFELTVELPGLEEKDVEVTLSDRLLTVSGEKKAEREEKDKNYRLVERSYGSFSRAIELPADIDAAGVKASFDQGVLKVTVPRVVKAEPKKIEVKAGR
jgi:HSP20 family protein